MTPAPPLTGNPPAPLSGNQSSRPPRLHAVLGCHVSSPCGPHPLILRWPTSARINCSFVIEHCPMYILTNMYQPPHNRLDRGAVVPVPVVRHVPSMTSAVLGRCVSGFSWIRFTKGVNL
ncbi:hypothetical protein DPEC_G00328910 [Dallia pectoralis]|uniref:Uncharacterized protein n=1 Tax=Dallia pectoralis TaxID=75939 RepID=A0ACC2F8J4_DALPE|nr:hypothetical protein DPEC_G00328910 [Dallia pectoralis]